MESAMTDLIFPALPQPGHPAGVTAAHGWNRAGGACLIDARNDVEAVITWLGEFTNRPNTFASYRKEAERFLLWAAKKRGKSLSSLTREDTFAYEAFMAMPDADWTGPTRPRGHPEWKPFARWRGGSGGLAASSRAQATVILGALFAYLIDAGYLQRNPFALKRGQRTIAAKSVEDRLLEKDSYDFLLGHLQRMPTETPRQIAHAERARWVITLYYQTALRLREVSTGNMGNFRLLRGNWWLSVIGKGNKPGKVPVTPTLLDALKRYRTQLGLPGELPASGETTPLVCTLTSCQGKAPAGINASALHKIIKHIFDQAATAARAKGQETIAANLSRASTHWLRHTSASHQLDAGTPLLVVSRNLRHANLKTTQLYLHTEDDEQHQASMHWDKPVEGTPS